MTDFIFRPKIALTIFLLLVLFSGCMAINTL